MIKILLVLSLVIIAFNQGHAQEYKLKGKIFLGQYFAPVGGVHVGFDSTNVTQTDLDGQFELFADEQQINDTLNIFFLNHNNIRIINLPKNRVIDLGTIPIYKYSYEIPLVHFDCGALDFDCKKKRKKFWEKYEKERAAYYDRVDTIIGYFKLSLNGKFYTIDTYSQIIDLAKPIQN